MRKCTRKHVVLATSSCTMFFSAVVYVKILNTGTTFLKPLYNAHHQDLKIMSLIDRCPLHRDFSQIGLLCLKRWCTIYPKVCQESIVWRRKSLKTIVRDGFVEINYWESKLKQSGIECVEQNFAKAKKEAFKQRAFQNRYWMI